MSKLFLDYDIINYQYGTPENALVQLKEFVKEQQEVLDKGCNDVLLSCTLSAQIGTLKMMITQIEKDIENGKLPRKLRKFLQMVKNPFTKIYYIHSVVIIGNNSYNYGYAVTYYYFKFKQDLLINNVLVDIKDKHKEHTGTSIELKAINLTSINLIK